MFLFLWADVSLRLCVKSLIKLAHLEGFEPPNTGSKPVTLLDESLLVLRWCGARFHNQSAGRDEDLLTLLIT